MVELTNDVRVLDDATDFEIAIPDEKGTPYWASVRKLIEGTMWIIDKRNHDILLTLNYAQERLYLAICQRLHDRKACQFIILKARQLGFTTFISAFNFVMTFFRKNQSCVVIANTTDNTANIFRKYRHYYDELLRHDPILAPKLMNMSGNRLMTLGTESGVRVAPATENAVVGTTVQMVHLSECGRMTNMQDLMEAVLAAVPEVEDNPVSFVFLESTAKGYNDFKDYWDTAVEENGSQYGFVPLFFPWFENPSYTKKYDGFQLLPHEKEAMDKYKLSLDQIAFYRAKYVEYKKSLNSLHQEYPCCPSEAFVATGSGVFDNDKIGLRKDVVRKIKPRYGFFDYKTKAMNGSIDDFSVTDKKFVATDVGSTELYELPQDGVPYVIGVDTAEGSGNDYTVAFVIRNDTKKEVAIFQSNSMDSDLCALQIYCLGTFYNCALVGVENNKSTSITSMLRKCNYENMYMRGDADDMSYDNVLMRYGVKTTSINKPQMKDIALEICRDSDYKNVSDYRTLTEMENFVYEESDKSDAVKIKGAGSKHDDCVMAMLITYYISNQQTSLVSYNEKKQESKLPWALQSDDEDSNEKEENFNVW